MRVKTNRTSWNRFERGRKASEESFVLMRLYPGEETSRCSTDVNRCWADFSTSTQKELLSFIGEVMRMNYPQGHFHRKNLTLVRASSSSRLRGQLRLPRVKKTESSFLHISAVPLINSSCIFFHAFVLFPFLNEVSQAARKSWLGKYCSWLVPKSFNCAGVSVHLQPHCKPHSVYIFRISLL